MYTNAYGKVPIGSNLKTIFIMEINTILNIQILKYFYLNN